MADIFRPPFFQPDSINGIPLAGAKLYFYTAGTSTLITVYQDFAATTPHASPVVADSSGIFPNIYVASPSYKIALYNAMGILIKTVDYIDNATNIGMVNVKDYGATGDGVTNDYAAIIRARNVAIATGDALGFPSGNYVIGSSLDLTGSGFKILALGQCTFTHTGTGRAIVFDGGGGVYDQVFGGPNSFYIVGNASTTDLLYINNENHSLFKANVRNGATGMRITGAVCSRFDFTCSVNEGAFTTRPNNGAYISSAFDCDMNLIVEGCGAGSLNNGVHFTGSAGNRVWGTSEGNLAGGVYMDSTSERNIFDGFDCESNGTGFDWDINGNLNVFKCTVGAVTALGQHLAGNNNVFEGCLFSGLTITGNKNTFLGGDTTISSDSGTGNVIKRDRTAADTNTNTAVPIMGHVTSAVAAGETKFFVHALLDGATSLVYIPIPEAGTFSNLTISTDGAPGTAESYVFTLRKLTSDTALTCTISGNASNQASDNTHTVAFAAGNIWCIKVVASASANTIGSILFGMKFLPS